MRHPDASCILYDDEDCNGEDGIRKMANGESILDVEKKSFKSEDREEFDVESVSVKKGCQLIVNTGIYYYA